MAIEKYPYDKYGHYSKFLQNLGEKLKPNSRVGKNSPQPWIIVNSFPNLLKELELISIPSYKYDQIKNVAKIGKREGELPVYCEKLYAYLKIDIKILKGGKKGKKILKPETVALTALLLMKGLGYVHSIKSGNTRLYFRTKLGEVINDYIVEKKVRPSNIPKVIILGSLLFPTKLRLLYLLYKVTPNPEEMFRILLAKLYARELITFERNAIEIIEEIYYTNYFKTKEVIVDSLLLWKLLPSINQYIDFESFARINNYVRTDDPYTGFPEFFKKFEPSIDTLKDKLLIDFAQYVSKKYKEINEYLQPLLYYV
jgi:hypothetical protein